MGFPWPWRSCLCAVVGLASAGGRHPLARSTCRRIAASRCPSSSRPALSSTSRGSRSSAPGLVPASPALLVVIPPLLSMTPVRWRHPRGAGRRRSCISARSDAAVWRSARSPRTSCSSTCYALPMFVLLGLASDVVAFAVDLASPGVVEMVLLDARSRASSRRRRGGDRVLAALVTYRLGSIRTTRHPDRHVGLDLLGAASLILAIVILGLCLSKRT